jgi:protein TonB
MLRRRKESEVTVRLLIDASGKITKCTSLSHFDEKDFNRITCARITERGRFEPAELADGTKVPSYYVTRVQFRIAD